MGAFKELDIAVMEYDLKSTDVDRKIKSLFGSKAILSDIRVFKNVPMVRVWVHRGAQYSYLSLLDKAEDKGNLPFPQLRNSHPSENLIYDKLVREQNGLKLFFKAVLNKTHFEIINQDENMLNLEVIINPDYLDTTIKIFNNIFNSKNSEGDTPINTVNFNIDVWVNLLKLMGRTVEDNDNKYGVLFTVDDKLFNRDNVTQNTAHLLERELLEKLGNYQIDGTEALSGQELHKLIQEKKNQPYLL